MRLNKHLIRFLKDKKHFSYFKTNVIKQRLWFRKFSIDCSKRSDFSWFIEISPGLSLDFEKYVSRNNYNDIKKILDLFLEYYNLHDAFYRSINKKTILLDFTNKKLYDKLTPIETLIETQQLTEYIQHAFRWNDTYEGFSCWYKIAQKWRKVAVATFYALLEKQTFNKPLFKTNEEYIEFINETILTL